MLMLMERVPMMLVTVMVCSQQWHAVLPYRRCDRASGAVVVVMVSAVPVVLVPVVLVMVAWQRWWPAVVGGGWRW